MFTSLAVQVARSPFLRRLLPKVLRHRFRTLPLAITYRREQCRQLAEKLAGGEVPLVSDYEPIWDHKVAIVRDEMWYFVYNVRACRDLGVPFQVIDLLGEDWIARARAAEAKIFLVWPPSSGFVQKQMFEDRLRAAATALEIEIVPSLEELWLQDSKYRIAYWLQAHRIPSPRTWIFYNEKRAMRFLDDVSFPLVSKTDWGASSYGVTILHSRSQARAVVRRAFGSRIAIRGIAPLDLNAGSVLFQEFIPHDHEWRVMRVGRYFLCRRKTRVGDYASGSGVISWDFPPKGLLDFVRQVTDRGGFRNMGVDCFALPPGDPRGRFLVNEMHPVVGAIANEADINDATGRWYLGPTHEWTFEPGFYYQNACANLRLEAALSRIGAKRIVHTAHVSQAMKFPVSDTTP